MEQRLSTRQDGDVLVITMDDGKVNSQDFTFVEQFNDALDQASDAKAVVVSGRPGMFSAGLNIKVMPTLDAATMKDFSQKYTELQLRLFSLPKPVVAACTGHAIAGGAVVLLGADLRIGTRGDYKIGLTEVQVGIALPSFVTTIAMASLPNQVHTPALMHGAVYDPEAALTNGFFHELCSESEQTVARACEEARRLAGLPPPAYRLTKQRMRGEAVERARRDDQGISFSS